MIIHQANAELTEAASAMIVRQMARALAAEPIDLSDDIAVMIRLSCAGFGSASIAYLMDRAIAQAKERAARKKAARFIRHPSRPMAACWGAYN